MGRYYKLLGILSVAFFLSIPVDNVNGQDVLDGIYIPEHSRTRKVIAYTPLREADVMWTKRIWRNIDLKEKINHPLYYPLEDKSTYKSLFRVIQEGINEGTITAYDVIDDEFRNPLTKDEVLEKLSSVDTQYVENFETGELEETVITNETKATHMRQYQLKEDWFFDRQKSIQDTRIIGIQPIKAKEDESGNEVGLEALFWIYYPQARYVFANQSVFNRQNDAEQRTYEDIFWKRMFNSYIIKEANVYDRTLYDYTKGIAFQFESERIKNELFLLEHDLWSF